MRNLNLAMAIFAVAGAVALIGCESAPPAPDATISFVDAGSADAQQPSADVTATAQPAAPCGGSNCDDGNPCTGDICEANTNTCVHLAIAATCDDGDSCTLSDVCANSKCAGAKIVCNDNNPCTDDACISGKCFAGINTAQCDDQNKCTEQDTCKSGQCVGTAIVCNDNNPCTTDSCDSKSGCFVTKVVCEDNDKCTDNSCDQATGACPFTAKVCTDNLPATLDFCNPVTGQCEYVLKNGACVKDTDCTDGKPCTLDVCDSFAGQCKFIDAVCDDQDPCTVDTCVNYGNDNWCDTADKCEDNDSKTLDVCDAKTGACSHSPAPDCTSSWDCNDGNACTTNTCQGGKCVYNPIACNDYNGCTTDICDMAKGCAYINNTAACDDWNSNTTNDTCQGGKCTGVTNPSPPSVPSSGYQCPQFVIFVPANSTVSSVTYWPRPVAEGGTGVMLDPADGKWKTSVNVNVFKSASQQTLISLPGACAHTFSWPGMPLSPPAATCASQSANVFSACWLPAGTDAWGCAHDGKCK